MFDLEFHCEVNRILNFRLPPQQFAKSDHEKQALKRKPHFPVHAMPNALVELSPWQVDLHAYVTEKYAEYFGLDMGHQLYRHKDAVYYLP